MKLKLGVVDVAYSDSETKGANTTGEVAEILESKYHIMRIFVEEKESKISQELVNAMAGEIESISQGKPYTGKLKVNTSSIESMFQDFLSAGEMEKIMPKTQPVKAAQAGVSHRKKHPYLKAHKARPAFIDTGLYQASFKAWIEE